MPELLAFTDKNYNEEVIQCDRPVLVYVTTRWCRPGRDLRPVIEQAAEEIQDKVKVGTLDADAEREFVRAHQIRTVPTVLLFKGGKSGARIAGRFTKLSLMSQVSAFLVEEKPSS